MNRWPLKRIICAMAISPIVLVAIVPFSALMLLGLVGCTGRWIVLTAEGEENVDFWGW